MSNALVLSERKSPAKTLSLKLNVTLSTIAAGISLAGNYYIYTHGSGICKKDVEAGFMSAGHFIASGFRKLYADVKLRQKDPTGMIRTFNKGARKWVARGARVPTGL